MAECPCTNISIMQLFHELKQKFPLIPDRVVSECIKKNGHDRVVLETVLERENRAYLLHSFPAAAAMSGQYGEGEGAEGEEDCCADQLHAAHLQRFQHGRQSLDSITRKTAAGLSARKSVTFRSVASDEQLHRREQCCCSDTVKPPRRMTTGADLKLEVGSGGCSTCKRTSVSVVSHSAPVTPCGCGAPAFPPVTVDVTARKHRTQLSLEPTAPFARNADCCSRPFTRVNLVLRTPSSEPQPPIDIASTAGGGLTYSSCSYDPRQGFQSRLQISIGPGGRSGCVSAARTRPPPATRLRPATSLPDVTTTSSALLHMSPHTTALLDPHKQALVSKQLEQKQRLEKELQREKEKLRFMQKEIELMERRLDGASTTMSTSSALHSRTNKVQDLRDEILRLREECKRMTSEVDQSDVPLGETSEEFYRHRHYTEQMSCPASLPVFPTRSENDVIHIPRHSSLDMSSSEQREAAAAAGAAGSAAAGDGPSWTCHVCTFRNHPLLKQCEQCDMPRINLGTTSIPSQSAPRNQPALTLI